MYAIRSYYDRLSFAAGYAGLLSSRLGPVPSGVVLAKGNGILAVPLTTDSLSVQDLFDRNNFV